VFLVEPSDSSPGVAEPQHYLNPLPLTKMKSVSVIRVAHDTTIHRVVPFVLSPCHAAVELIQLGLLLRCFASQSHRKLRCRWRTMFVDIRWSTHRRRSMGGRRRGKRLGYRHVSASWFHLHPAETSAETSFPSVGRAFCGHVSQTFHTTTLSLFGLPSRSFCNGQCPTFSSIQHSVSCITRI
jgi:hypothetical protein